MLAYTPCHQGRKACITAMQEEKWYSNRSWTVLSHGMSSTQLLFQLYIYISLENEGIPINAKIISNNASIHGARSWPGWLMHTLLGTLTPKVTQNLTVSSNTEDSPAADLTWVIMVLDFHCAWHTLYLKSCKINAV